MEGTVGMEGCCMGTGTPHGPVHDPKALFPLGALKRGRTELSSS